MEDLEYDDGESLLNDLQGAVVTIVLLMAFSFATMMFFISSGIIERMLEDNRFITLGLIIGYWVIIIIVSYFVVKKEQRKQKERMVRENKIKKSTIEESPILYIPMNNQRGEYKEHICPICNEAILNSLEIVACPQCSTVFHTNHLLKWAEKNDECPKCQFKLRK